MRILYNNDGIPFILGENDTIIDFTPGNQNYIVGELATDTDTMQKLFKDVKSSIDKKIKDYSNSPKNNFSEAGYAIDYLRKALQLAYIIDVCNQAEDLHYMITTPKEHEQWIWNSQERKWTAPFPIPYGEPGERYKWSDEYSSWIVATECPHEGWLWDGSVHNWVPPIKYPIDAGPEEFVWDNESHTWVLNKES